MIGILLCGGAGRRVAGADKPLLGWRGRPMFESVVERLRPQVTQLLISANRNQAVYAAYGPVIADLWPDYQGPLAGIASVLQWHRQHSQGVPAPFLICPGDMPAVPHDLGQRLSAQRAPRSVRYAVAADQPQPLCMVCTADDLDSMLDYLRSGRRSALGWLKLVGASGCHFSDAAAFRNHNLPADFNE